MSDLPMHLVIFSLTNDKHSVVKKQCVERGGFLDYVMVNGVETKLPDGILCIRAQSGQHAVEKFGHEAAKVAPTGMTVESVFTVPLTPGYMAGNGEYDGFMLEGRIAYRWEGAVQPGKPSK